MKRNKSGISLIVLVITIIVMIILASAVIISLSNSNIINKANEAVNASNLKQVQQLASLAWAEAYLDENIKTDEQYEEYVKGKLEDNNIKLENYHIEITANGVKVEKNGITLGSLITSAADYGKTVNYVSDNGVTDWKVFYEDETNGYVYLIASEKLAYDKMPTNIPRATLKLSTVTLADSTKRTVGDIYWALGSAPSSAATIQNASRWMANWGNYDSYSTNINGRCVSYFLDETYWTAFKNTTSSYASYVLGAIGTPTAEMFVASWNAKRLTEANTDKIELTLTADGTDGYQVNGSSSTSIATTDTLYIWSTASYTSTWLASPSGGPQDLLFAGSGGRVSLSNYISTSLGARPVVCLNSNIPAQTGTTTDFAI